MGPSWDNGAGIWIVMRPDTLASSSAYRSRSSGYPMTKTDISFNSDFIKER